METIFGVSTALLFLVVVFGLILGYRINHPEAHRRFPVSRNR